MQTVSTGPFKPTHTSETMAMRLAHGLLPQEKMKAAFFSPQALMRAVILQYWRLGIYPHLVPCCTNLFKAPCGQQEVDVIFEGIKGRVGGGAHGSIKVSPEAARQIQVRAGHRAIAKHLQGVGVVCAVRAAVGKGL